SAPAGTGQSANTARTPWKTWREGRHRPPPRPAASPCRGRPSVNEAMSDPHHNLPLSAAPIGRERDVADLLRIVRNTRSVSLVGAGGIGKTLLAVRVAEAALPAFEHGVRFVDLKIGRASCRDRARRQGRADAV